MAEEAAAVAQEYISGLDNLPAEVAHLLGEIKTKEERCQELTLRLHNRTSSILKHVRTALPLWTPYPKEAATLPKIASEFDKLAAMQAEKIVYAERLVGLMAKHVKKLELEVLGKVADLGGVPVPPLPVIPGVGGVGLPSTPRGSASGAAGVGGRLGEVFAMDGAGGGSQKKRRLNPLHPPGPNSTSSSSLSSSIPLTSSSFYPQPHPNQYLPQQQQQQQQLPQAYLPPQKQQQQQQRAQKRQRTPDDVIIVPAGGAYEGEGEMGDEGGDDETPYCVCRQKSFGTMVGCDNEGCAIEWFHVKCVGVEEPLPDQWFCDDCKRLPGAVPEKKQKKGRKGQ